MGVRRECYGCGRVCADCRVRYMRTCRFCQAEYCIVDNEGSSETWVCLNQSHVVSLDTHADQSVVSSATGATKVADGLGSYELCNHH